MGKGNKEIFENIIEKGEEINLFVLDDEYIVEKEELINMQKEISSIEIIDWQTWNLIKTSGEKIKIALA